MYTQPYEFINNSKIISGKRALENIPIELKSYNSQKPFVLASGEGASLKKKFISAFSDSDTPIGCLFDAVPSVVKKSLIDDLGEIYEKRGCDSIIAIGDSHAVNTARALNAYITHGELSVFDKPGNIKFSTHTKPFFLVPCGSSCETDLQGTISVEGKTYTSESLFPDLICIDRRMSKPADNIKSLNTGLSALVHAVESSMDSLNPMTDAYAHAAIHMIHDTLPDIAAGNPSAHRAMKFVNGVMFSGIALSNSDTGMTHALGEILSGLTGKPAGLYMGILLPFVLEFLKNKLSISREDLLIPFAGMEIYAETPEDKRTETAIDYIRKLYMQIGSGLPMNLRKAGINDSQLAECAESASKDKRWKLSAKDYHKLLDHAHTGIPMK